MKRTARLADVARAAGVSQGTASNVFNRPELVRQEVRERVEASARRLGYCGPDPRGRLLRAGRANAIGIVTSDHLAYTFRDPYMREVMAGIAAECDARGAGLSFVSSVQQDGAWRVETALVDGFIVDCLKVGEDLVALARERRLPFVALDLDAGPGTSSVLVDDRRGGHLAADHLLGLGHRAIGILALECGPEPAHGWSDAERQRAAVNRFEHDRVAGYAEALAGRGVALERVPILESPNERAAAARWAGELLAARPETTAVLAMSDVLAMGVLDAAAARGLRVPQDLSVVGFDDIPDAARSAPPLTTVAQPMAEKGRLAARLIFDEASPRVEVLGVELKVRASTAPPRG